MKLIENPIHFFKQIDNLIPILTARAPRNTDEPFIWVFHEDTIKEVPSCLTLHPQLSHRPEPTANTVPMRRLDLCRFSVDQEEWVAFPLAGDHPQISPYLLGQAPEEDFTLYLCDITATFYTVITRQSYVAFLFWGSQFAKEGDLILHNRPQDCLAATEAAIRAQTKAGTVTLLTTAELTPQTFSVDSLINHSDLQTKDYKDAEKALEAVRKRYAKLPQEKAQKLLLFNKQIELKAQPQAASLYPVVCAFETVFSCANPKVKSKISAITKKTLELSKLTDDREQMGCELQELTQMLCECFTLCVSLSAPIFEANSDLPELSLLCDLMLQNQVKLTDLIDGELIDFSLALLYFDLFCALTDASYQNNSSEKQARVERFRRRVEEETMTDYSVAGILSGIFVTGIATSIYEAVTDSDDGEGLVSAEEAERYRNEFLQTENSKRFFGELVLMDMKHAFLLLMATMDQNAKINAKPLFQSTREKLADFSTLAEHYRIAARLQATFLADQENLILQPSYDESDLDEFVEKIAAKYEYSDPNEITCSEVAQELLLLFPYDASFYASYLQYGGEATEELHRFACGHLVELAEVIRSVEKRKQENEMKRTLQEQQMRQEEERQKRLQEEEDRKKKLEAERLQRQKEEAEQRAKQRLHEEKIRIAEEKKRKEEQDAARKLKALKALPARYGEIAPQHADLFYALLENPLYIDDPDFDSTEPAMLTEKILRFVDKNYDFSASRLYTTASTHYQRKYTNMMNAYGAEIFNTEPILFYCDDTVFGGGKEGFMLTTHHFCYKNIGESGFLIPLDHVKSISLTSDGKRININGTRSVTYTIGCVSIRDICNILNFAICNLLYMTHNCTIPPYSFIPAPPFEPTPTPPSPPTDLPPMQVPQTNYGTPSVGYPPMQPPFGAPPAPYYVPPAPTPIYQQQTEGWICRCGATNVNQNTFCMMCGAPHKPPQSWKCPDCGRENDIHGNFCGNCGRRKTL